MTDRQQIEGYPTTASQGKVEAIGTTMILTVLTALLLGAFAWTFLEYVIHRWFGHDARTRPTPFAAEHVRHHSEGNYFAPSWKKAVVAVVFALVLIGPSVALAGTVAGSCFVAGLIAMSVAYEVLHRRALPNSISEIDRGQLETVLTPRHRPPRPQVAQRPNKGDRPRGPRGLLSHHT